MNKRIRIHTHQLVFAVLSFVLLMSIGCSSSKPAQRSPSQGQSGEKEKVPMIYNPSTGKYEPVKDPQKQVDTIWFREDKESKPIGSVETKEKGKKALYEVAFLIPFNAEDNVFFTANIDPSVRRFIHYYAGVKMALQDLADQGVKISARIYDTHDSPQEARRLIQALENVDVVVGPYEVESIRDAAAFSSRRQVPVFSPWTPSISLEGDHPWFVQLTPGLEAHAEAIVDYIDTHLAGSKVYMVSRNDAREISRLLLFRDAHERNNTIQLYEELIIDDASVNLTDLSLKNVVDREGSTVFIVPYFSRNDEDFINSFLRKLHAEKETGTVYVFGMPQWLTFSKLNPDYLESANVHISTAHFMDASDPEVQAFQKRFLSEYGTLPEPAAHQGFEFVHFLGEALHHYGTGFLEHVSDRLSAPANENFDLVEIYRNPIPERRNVPNYLENRAIRILRFIDQAYRKVE
jgi:ABC-type branched-subunit amino acid transport system substrate-binding protein